MTHAFLGADMQVERWELLIEYGGNDVLNFLGTIHVGVLDKDDWNFVAFEGIFVDTDKDGNEIEVVQTVRDGQLFKDLCQEALDDHRLVSLIEEWIRDLYE